MKNQALRHLYLKTAALCALVSLVVSLRVDFAWGSTYALYSIFGLLNWFLLGHLVLAMLEKRLGVALLALAGKFLALGIMLFGVLRQTDFAASAFLLGYNTFLIVCLSDAVGSLVLARVQGTNGGRSASADTKALLMGKQNG